MDDHTDDDAAPACLTLDLEALVANWRDLDARSRPGRAAAVVKADAYGLGVADVVPALVRAGCDTFFVALASEGATVRALAPDARIFVLGGTTSAPLSALMANRLIPVIGEMATVMRWSAATDAPFALQVDTGMNRLGVTVSQALALAADRNMPRPCHVLSHFACADQPDHPMNRQQRESFQSVASAFAGIESSLSNSAATLSGGAFGHALTRPGIGLYGGEALEGVPNPMRVVMTLEARILQIRHAKAGETVSYGATHRLTHDTKIAVVGVGYADGYPRSASGSGVALRSAVPAGAQGFVDGHRVTLIGRVTMDLTMFDVTDVPDGALADGWIELIGPHVPLDVLARAAGTIGYEVLTRLGTRFQRMAKAENA